MDKVISFDVAALAKKKEYNETCYSAYSIWRDKIRRTQNEETALSRFEIGYEIGYESETPILVEFFQNSDYTLAPTRGDLKNWLFTKYGIIMTVTYSSNSVSNDYYFVYNVRYLSDEKLVNIDSDLYKDINLCYKDGFIKALNSLVLKPISED